ncbi:MAG TPA: galactokinase, partial [Bacillota bacterium]|nr:galactokinase [Bacillota bacterium]
LADTAQKTPGVLGARMTGAGFGGCTINLLQFSQIDAFKAAITSIYQQTIGLTPSFYQPGIGDGAREINTAALR